MIHFKTFIIILLGMLVHRHTDLRLASKINNEELSLYMLKGCS